MPPGRVRIEAEQRTMVGDVTLRDGIELTLADGRTVVADASDPAADLALLSHAHGDHLYDRAPEEIVASTLTLDLAQVRRSEEPRPAQLDSPTVTQLSAGHVPGSSAFLIEGERRYLYTGDVSVRDRFGMAGFKPVSADVLVIESTYGQPTYRFPDQGDLEGEIVDWLADTADAPVVLFGYALGRAQELLRLADRADRSRIFYTSAIEALSQPIEAAMDEPFRGSLYAADVELGPGDALILPSQTNSLGFVDRLKRETDAITAGFSGWAIEDSYRFARDVDVAIPLSDHCDFDELLEVVRTVDPDQVYTVHGFVDDFADAVRSRLGIAARSLKSNQTSLTDF